MAWKKQSALTDIDNNKFCFINKTYCCKQNKRMAVKIKVALNEKANILQAKRIRKKDGEQNKN